MIRIGISGWRYEPWRGVFYPKDLAQKDELRFASRQVSSIEINGSFYSLQSPASYKHWHEETPGDFVFAVKGPRYLTHIRRLKEPRNVLANFYGSGVLHLKEKLGPFLWQLPPSFRYEEEKLEIFLKMLPKTFADAKTLTKHADRVEPDVPTERKFSDLPLRHAMEVRSTSFENPIFIEQLRRHGVALVFADTAGTWPYFEDLTSDFVYVRLHGEEALYSSGYGGQALRFWAKRILSWSKGSQVTMDYTLTDEPADGAAKDVFVYFDNDVKVHAPKDARELARILKVADELL